MMVIDPELRRTFELLGITPEQETVYPPNERPRRKIEEMDDDAIVHWLRLLGAKAPSKLVEEIRRRKLMKESELRLWLGEGTDAA
jgi:hypothetical protein